MKNSSRLSLLLLLAAASCSLCQAAGSCTYTVQSGDTLFQIARDSGLSLEELLDTPGNEKYLRNPDYIVPGDEVQLCSGGSSSAGTTSGAYPTGTSSDGPTTGTTSDGPTTGSSPASTGAREFATESGGSGCPDVQAVLDEHNAARVRRGAAPLRWSSTLAQFAQGVANTCIMEHSNGPYGENLASGLRNCADAVAMWMSEESEYVPGSGFSYNTGHFTQVVWKSTTEVGCGFAACGLVACSYDPPGNYAGQFPSNV